MRLSIPSWVRVSNQEFVALIDRAEQWLAGSASGSGRVAPEATCRTYRWVAGIDPLTPLTRALDSPSQARAWAELMQAQETVGYPPHPAEHYAVWGAGRLPVPDRGDLVAYADIVTLSLFLLLYGQAPPR